MSHTAEQPRPSTLAEIPLRIHEILEWSVANPVDDYVMHFPYNPDNNKLISEFKGVLKLAPLRGVDAVIAGSCALHRILPLIDKKFQNRWRPKDSDVFFLNQEENNRVPFNTIDLVQCKEKTVDELLLNFDLPICRVAFNFACDFWISAQCLAAIFSHKQNVPVYLQTKKEFRDTITKHMTNFTNPHAHEYLYNRFTERVKKYQDRGYGVNWIETDVIIPWVKNRFCYGEWLLPEHLKDQ